MQTIPVLISINAIARREDEQDEPMAMLTSGRMTVEDERVLIHYEETLDESLPAQPVEITVAGNTVSMVRGGAFETSMVFCKGQRFEGQYRTPYGDMELAVYCTRLRHDLTDGGGELRLSSQLDLNGQFVAMHEMELRLIPQNGQAD